ncbi:MAG: FAD-dependent oxidoreductase, partial [bacterium]|nr:FAD-dependent oxidoreductase [bacterium]
MAIKTVELEIKGMTCDHCALSIGKKVSQLDGIVSQSVSFPEKSGQFQFDEEKVSKAEIIQAINSTGQYQVVGEIERSPADEKRFDLIIIGGGSAAFSAAIKASELGKKTLMINDGLPIGGTCVNVGCVPSKTLIRTAEQLYHANHPHFSGIKPGKNSLDFKEVIRQKTELVNELRQSKYMDVLQDDANVTILHARAKLIDNHQVEAAGNVYTGEKILLAAGSSTYVPDIPGLNDTGYLTNDTLYDLETLPKYLIVLGGRYIALENAQLFARLG